MHPVLPGTVPQQGIGPKYWVAQLGNPHIELSLWSLALRSVLPASFISLFTLKATIPVHVWVVALEPAFWFLTSVPLRKPSLRWLRCWAAEVMEGLGDGQNLSPKICCFNHYPSAHFALALPARAQPIVVWGVGGAESLIHAFYYLLAGISPFIVRKPPSLFTFYKLHVIKSSCRSGFCNWQSPQSRADGSVIVLILTSGVRSALQAFSPLSSLF
jgi:hypothetical protein